MKTSFHLVLIGSWIHGSCLYWVAIVILTIYHGLYQFQPESTQFWIFVFIKKYYSCQDEVKHMSWTQFQLHMKVNRNISLAYMLNVIYSFCMYSADHNENVTPADSL